MAEPIRILTLWDPWAQLAALGLKGNETRPFRTSYRGLLAIHASKAFTRAHRLLRVDQPFRDALRDAGEGFYAYETWPRGAVIAIAELTAVERILRVGPDERPVKCTKDHHPHGPRDVVTVGSVPLTDERELAFGLYCTGRWAWKLERVRRTRPVPVRGQQGIRVWVPSAPLEYLEATP